MPFKQLTKDELWLQAQKLEGEANNDGLPVNPSDRSKQQALENLLEEKNKLLDTVLNNVDAFIYMKDEQRHFHYVNNKTAKLFGQPSKDIIGQLDSDVLGQKMADHFWQSDKLVFQTNHKQIINEVGEDAEGNTRHYLST